MSSYMQKAGVKLFAKHIDQYRPQDPLYEEYTDERGRLRRRKRAVPPGLSPRDAKILKSVQRRAHYLDKSFSICGLRFGWSVIIGLVPGIGDFADFLLSYYVVLRKARQADLPGWLVRRMLLNCIISAVIGFVPAVGDIAVGVFKPNSRNAALLEEFLRIRGEEYVRMETEMEAKKAGVVAEGSGLSKKDIEQVKPGAGMETATGQPSTSGAASSTLTYPPGRNSQKQKADDGQGRFVENLNSGTAGTKK
ncbi:hypothetical protein ID866_5990 [Astraeus odoratus]|nr:hypothetical protein ID866_5990 [Astraeus odoratus]